MSWYARGLRSAAFGCSDGSASGDDAAAHATTGAAGAGGAGGAGGVANGGDGSGAIGGTTVAFEIASLTSDSTLVTEVGGALTFTALLTHPEGVAAIVGGTLSHGASPSALFHPVDEAGTYEATVGLEASAGFPDDAFVVFLATFQDQNGTQAEKSKVIQFDIGGCSLGPDYDSCRACYCEADPTGCASYTSREYEYLSCGTACTSDCLAFCATVSAGTPDPLLIDLLCDGCNPSPADQDAFYDSCLADIPACFGFLVALGDCPPR